MGEHIKFRFKDPDPDGVEGDIGLAIFSAECIYGRPQTRLEAGYWLSVDGTTVVFDVGGPAGESALRVLVGLVGARFGEGGYSVERRGDSQEVEGRP